MSEPAERALWFGPEDGLLGIVALPPPDVKRPHRLGVVLMNPGTLHRVGGARLNVRLARHLAARGIPSIRFDFPGLGDSQPRLDLRPYLESMSSDLGSAMDELTRQAGATHFALAGHCTGAAISFEAALLDTRVVAVVQIEGYAYPTRRYPLYRWKRILLSGSNWAALLNGKKDLKPLARRVAQRLTRQAQVAATTGARDAQSVEEARRQIRGLADLLPSRQEMRVALGRLVARRVRMLNIFAGGDHHYYSYRDQFIDAFPGIDFRGMLEVEHVPDANHYFSAPRHQRWLDDRIARLVEAAINDVEVNAVEMDRPIAPPTTQDHAIGAP